MADVLVAKEHPRVSFRRKLLLTEEEAGTIIILMCKAWNEGFIEANDTALMKRIVGIHPNNKRLLKEELNPGEYTARFGEQVPPNDDLEDIILFTIEKDDFGYKDWPPFSTPE